MSLSILSDSHCVLCPPRVLSAPPDLQFWADLMIRFSWRQGDTGEIHNHRRLWHGMLCPFILSSSSLFSTLKGDRGTHERMNGWDGWKEARHPLCIHCPNPRKDGQLPPVVVIHLRGVSLVSSHYDRGIERSRCRGGRGGACLAQYNIFLPNLLCSLSFRPLSLRLSSRHLLLRTRILPKKTKS